MDIYFKPLTPRELKDFIPIATVYRIWSESLKQYLRLYKNNDQMYVKIPGSDWMSVIEKKRYKLGDFETDIDLILPIKKDEEEQDEME